MDKELLDHILSFVSEHKKNLFEKILPYRTNHLTVVLEDIYQPHNASAVLRSCDVFGIQTVHIIENNNQYEVNPKVALGASKWLTLNKYNELDNNTSDCLKKLKTQGYKIVATSPLQNSTPINELNIEDKTALIFGSELNGLSKTVFELADETTYISMFGFTESLNISVSAAICLKILRDKLNQSTINWQLTPDEMDEIKLDWAKKIVKNADIIEKEYLKQRN
ncbi:MAG: RNA methyltransferase [Vicingaceae bacterium]